MKDSTFGNAAPKSRAINVGTNLLGEWTAEQSRLRREVGLSAALLGGSLFVVLVALPMLLRSAALDAARSRELRRQVAGLDATLQTADQARKAAQPALLVRAMRDRTTASYDRFLGELGQAMSAGNARTAVASLKLEVSAAEIHMTVVADAEEDGAADSFARNAGEAGAKVDAITSSRPSTVLGEQGMGFTYEKRIGVAP